MSNNMLDPYQQGGGTRQLPPRGIPGQNPPPAPVTPPKPNEPPQNAAGSGASQTGATSLPGTLDQPMYPWLMPWSGPFAAPMSSQQNQALGGMSNFAGSGFGLGGANNYLNNVMGGQYLDVANNPYFKQIQESGQTLKQYQDQQALKQIQSQMAAGGNAMSGASAGAQSDYLGRSNASFENMMAQLMAQQYGQERGLQSQAASQAGNLAQIPLAGYTTLAGLGAIPQDTAQREISGQYSDFLRQGGALRDQFQYPDYLSMQTLNRGYPGQYQNMFGPSQSTQLTNLFGASGIGSDLINWLLGSGGGGSADGVTMPAYDGYDATQAQTQKAQYANWLSSMGAGTTPGQNYQDRLTQEIQQSHAVPPGSQASGATKAFSILGMILALLGGKGKSGGGGGASSGGGGNLGKILDSLFGGGTSYINNTPNTPGQTYDQPIGPGLSGSPGGIPGLTDGGGGSFSDYYNNLPPIDTGGGGGGNFVPMDPNMLGPMGGDPTGGFGGDGGGWDPGAF